MSLRLIIFSIILIFVSTKNTYSQKVDKNLVVIEVATGTWCWACPYAALAAEQLHNNDKKVVIIENHKEDDFETEASISRIDYYGISLFPTTYFNGRNAYNGTPEPNKFLEIYNYEIARKSDFMLDAFYTKKDSVITLTVDIEDVGDFDYTGYELVLHVVLTETHIDYEWQNMLPEISFTNREMYPDENGTPLDFSIDSVFNKQFFITIDKDFNIDNCEITAFIQSNATKEILQADNVSLGNVYGDNSVSVEKIISPNLSIVGDKVNPVIEIRNRGNDTLLSAQIDYSINNGANYSFMWNGSLETNQRAIVELDSIYYVSQDTNLFEVSINNPNGIVDEYLTDNTLSKSFYDSIVPPLYITVRTNSTAENFYWKLYDSNGVVQSGMGFSADTVYKDEVLIDKIGSYKFCMGDTDGYGTTEVKVVDAKRRVVFISKELFFEEEKVLDFNIKRDIPTVKCNIDNNAVSIKVDTSFILTFNQPIRKKNNSLLKDNDMYGIIEFIDSSGNSISSDKLINDDYTVITIIPRSNLEYSTGYSLSVENVESFSGGLIIPYTMSFITEALVSIVENKIGVKCYPNPVNNILTIEKAAGSSLNIYSIVGSLVSTKIITNNFEQLDLSELNNGTYIFEVYNNNHRNTFKIQIID